MFKKEACFLVLLLFYGCPKPVQQCQENPADPNQVCIEIYDPVCGCNKVTYSNACYAERRGIEDYTPGECSN